MTYAQGLGSILVAAYGNEGIKEPAVYPADFPDVISVVAVLLKNVVGTGLGVAVVRALRDQGFTDTTLPWAQMGVYVGLAAVVGVVAAVLPAIRAARLNVLGAIAHE